MNTDLFVVNLLSSDSYTPMNKFLARKIWIEETVYFCELVREWKRFWMKKFYFSQNQMESEIWMTFYSQNKAVKKLSSLWFIKVERKDKYYFDIDSQKVMDFIMLWNQGALKSKNECFEIKAVNNNNSNNENNTFSYENVCVDTQKENLWWNNTIETQQTEKEASWQIQENIQEYKTKEWKEIAERFKKWVTFDDVVFAFPSMKNFDNDKAQKKFKALIDSWMSIDKMFLNAFFEKLLLRVNWTDYRYVMRFDNWLNSYHEIDDEMEDAKIQEILSKFWSTKDKHNYKESVYQVLEDVVWKERVMPIMKNITRMTIMVDWKVLNQ